MDHGSPKDVARLLTELDEEVRADKIPTPDQQEALDLAIYFLATMDDWPNA